MRTIIQKKIRRLDFSLVIVCVLLLTLAASQVLAQQSEIDNSVSIAVSPQILELSANPGDTISSNFRLTNGGDLAIAIEVQPRNFTPRGEDGAVELTEETTPYSLAQWIDTSPQTTTIEPRETHDFATTISIPENAEPGGHFGSVVFRTIPSEQEGTAALVSQEIAPVILVRIAGDVIESAEIASFQSTRSIWTNQDTLSFETRVRNTGNVHLKPSGKIEIKNIFGDTVSSIELDERNVIPDATRRTTSSWNNTGFKFGRYNATLTLTYGESAVIETDTTSFTVVPYQTILPYAILLGFLLFLVLKFRERIVLALKILSGKSTDPQK